MEKIKITRRMLNKGIQGRIYLREVDRFNKSVDVFNLAKAKKEKPNGNLFMDVQMESQMEDSDMEDLEVLRRPKLGRVRHQGGFF